MTFTRAHLDDDDIWRHYAVTHQLSHRMFAFDLMNTYLFGLPPPVRRLTNAHTENEAGNIVSPLHDIPLYANDAKTVYNMVVEVPRWTNAKMEVITGGSGLAVD